jgi:ABC-type Na+ efflux pump permease subunit
MFAIIKFAVSFILLLITLGLVAYYAKIASTYKSLQELTEEQYVKGIGLVTLFLPILGFFILISIGRGVVKAVILVRNFIPVARDFLRKQSTKSAGEQTDDKKV